MSRPWLRGSPWQWSRWSIEVEVPTGRFRAAGAEDPDRLELAKLIERLHSFLVNHDCLATLIGSRCRGIIEELCLPCNAPTPSRRFHVVHAARRRRSLHFDQTTPHPIGERDLSRRIYSLADDGSKFARVVLVGMACIFQAVGRSSVRSRPPHPAAASPNSPAWAPEQATRRPAILAATRRGRAQFLMRSTIRALVAGAADISLRRHQGRPYTSVRASPSPYTSASAQSTCASAPTTMVLTISRGRRASLFWASVSAIECSADPLVRATTVTAPTARASCYRYAAAGRRQAAYALSAGRTCLLSDKGGQQPVCRRASSPTTSSTCVCPPP